MRALAKWLRVIALLAFLAAAVLLFSSSGCERRR